MEELITNHKIMDILPHHNINKYPKQEILILKKENYTYYVPFLQNNDEIILKTIVPSRKYNKKYGEKNVNKL